MKQHLIWTLALTLAFSVAVTVHAASDDGVESRAALTITSKPAASPKSPAVLADTTFTAAASGTGTVIYTWDFGDGTPQALGATVIHNYSASGTFNVVLTVADGSGTTLTSPLAVVVTDSVTSPKLLITLNFKKPGNDSIFLTGVMRIPPNTKLDAQPITVTVGGVVSTFTLNQIGQSKTGGSSIKVFVKPIPDSELVSTFFLNIKGDFQSTLAANANLTNRNANRDPVKVKVAVTFLGISYSASVSQTFLAHKGLRGITR